jgi:hypothetical protein
MGSRRKTGSETLRLPELSRRAVLAGTSAVALGVPKSAAATIPSAAAVAGSDEGTKRCARWLAINAKIERLESRWIDLEHWLVNKHQWFQLSPAEQGALPGEKELRDIDGCLDVLFEQRDAMLGSLPTSGSVSVEAVIVRLAVAERLLWPDEHPQARALVAGALQDLIALSGETPRFLPTPGAAS